MPRGWYWQKVEKTWCSASMVPRHQGEVLEQYINDWQNWYLRVLTVSVAILVKMLFTVITPIIPGLPLNIVCFMTDLGGLLLSDLDIARSSCWCEIRSVQVANSHMDGNWCSAAAVRYYCVHPSNFQVIQLLLLLLHSSLVWPFSLHLQRYTTCHIWKWYSFTKNEDCGGENSGVR